MVVLGREGGWWVGWSGPLLVLEAPSTDPKLRTETVKDDTSESVERIVKTQSLNNRNFTPTTSIHSITFLDYRRTRLRVVGSVS